MSGIRSRAPRGLRHTMVSIAPLTVAVQLCSLISSIAFARVLGASVATDAYYLGLSIPSLAYGILMSGLREGGIPALTEAEDRSHEELTKAGSELMSSVFAASLVLAVVVTVITEFVLPAFVGGHMLSLTRTTVLELAPYTVLGGLTGAFSAILAIKRVFVIPVAALAFEPLAKTVLVVTLGHQIGIQSLILGNLVGSALTVVALWRLTIRHGVNLRLVKRFDTPFVRTTARLSTPLILSSSVLVVNPVIDRVMASGVGTGSVTALELGLRLLLPFSWMTTSLLGGPIVASWSRRRAEGGRAAVVDSANRAVSAAALLLTPCVVLGILLRHDVVVLLYSGGAYPQHALNVTGSVFGMIMLSLPMSFLILITSTFFIVEKDTVFLLKNGCVNVILNIALNFALRPILGVAGIALSTTLTLTFLVFWKAGVVHHRWGAFSWREMAPIARRTLVSAGFATAVALATESLLPGAATRADALLTAVVVSAIVVLLHAGTMLVLRDPYARVTYAAARNVLRSALARWTSPNTPAARGEGQI